MINPVIVSKNFSRDPEYYHQNALAQRRAALELSRKLERFQGLPVAGGRILEIGCGTGFLTRELFRLFPGGGFLVTDISESMLAICESRTADMRSGLGISADFSVLDMTSDPVPGKFDMIVSSLAFQWSGNIGVLLCRLRNALSPGGVLGFSIQTQGTFGELHELFLTHSVPFPHMVLPSSADVVAECSIFPEVSVSEHIFEEVFGSLRDFLRHIQRTGAGNASGDTIPVAGLRRLLKLPEKEIRAEYTTCHVIATI
ncbi:MAG: methyltransferase domain-containing protein [Victivallales bacterium]|nr:methyltransferase domain-containing protein [Victivallales bacterium]